MYENDKQEDDIEIDENDKTEDVAYWKELALKQQGINKRFKTKDEKRDKEIEELKKELVEFKKPKEFTPEKPEKSNELDYGQKAYLKAYGISGPDEIALAKSFMERTGDPLETIVEDEIFTGKLKGLRDAKVAKEAIPLSKRTATGSKDNIDVWMDKPFEEVPPELKQEVLNRRLITEKEGGKFTDQPVIMGR
jgi:hypothetical protein